MFYPLCLSPNKERIHCFLKKNKKSSFNFLYFTLWKQKFLCCKKNKSRHKVLCIRDFIHDLR